MKNIINCLVFLIFIKFAISGNPKDEKEIVLDILGDNDWEAIDTDFSDPGVIVFTPKANSEVSKVMYGDVTLWNKGKKSVLEKVMAFKSQMQVQFIHIFYKQGIKHMGVVIARAGDKWKMTGKYEIEKEKERDKTPSKVKNIFSKFVQRLRKKPEAQAEQEAERESETVEFELSEDPSEIFKVKKYISVGIPTIWYRPYFGKKISKVTDSFQTIWSEDKKNKLTSIYAFNKLGFNRLLYIDTGNNPYQKGAFFENHKDEWRSMSRESFFYKLRLRYYNQEDPQFENVSSLSLYDLEDLWRYRHSSESSSGSPSPQRRHSPLRRAVRRRYDYEGVPDKEEEEEEEGPRSPVERSMSPLVRPPSNEGSYMNYPIQEKTPSEGAKSEKDELSLEFPISEGDMSISWPYKGGDEQEEKKEEQEGSPKPPSEPIYTKVIPRKQRVYESLSEPTESSYSSHTESGGSSNDNFIRSIDGLKLEERSIPLTSGSLHKSDGSIEKEGLESYTTPEEGSENGSVKFTEGYKKLFMPSSSDESSLGENKDSVQEGHMTTPEFEQPSSLRSDIGSYQSEENLPLNEPIYINMGGPVSHQSEGSNSSQQGQSPFRFIK